MTHTDHFDIYAPVILRWNGSDWSEVDVTVQAYSLILRSVDMVSETDGWIVGGGLWANSSTILRWDGTSWKEIPHSASSIITTIATLFTPSPCVSSRPLRQRTAAE